MDTNAALRDALVQVVGSGRVSKPHLLHPAAADPDAAWKRNEPVPKKDGASILFDFKWLPKPELVPPTLRHDAAAAVGSGGAPEAMDVEEDVAAAPASLAGRKRKAADDPMENGAS